MQGGLLKTSTCHQAGCVGYTNSPPTMQLGRLSTNPSDAPNATNAPYQNFYLSENVGLEFSIRNEVVIM